MTIKVVVEPIATRKTEYYAISQSTELEEDDIILGPFTTSVLAEKFVDDGGFEDEWIIVTKVRKVVVS